MTMIDLSRPEPERAWQGRCYVVHKQALCVVASPPQWRLLRLPGQALRYHSAYTFIGWLADEPCYVCQLVDHDLTAQEALAPVPLRHLLGVMDEAEYTMASRALQFLSWRDNHRFCSRCGTPAESHGRELAMLCPACGYRQYPRITPCIISLVCRGEYALLGRSARFPEGMYSCLAGFMEAGETAEQAVAREVREESGVEIHAIQYFSSQSWPFPHSLMLGFHAQYHSGDLVIDDDEIVAADWFHYRQLPDIPPVGSIARRLIDHWVERHEAPPPTG